mmetsp:Transcript_13329/g.24156  ORF Transcript_13329/g.24156 Transcript_13329/m.24156 type:complete len:111 (+) Transcript_13329:473-805(+)
MDSANLRDTSPPKLRDEIVAFYKDPTRAHRTSLKSEMPLKKKQTLPSISSTTGKMALHLSMNFSSPPSVMTTMPSSITSVSNVPYQSQDLAKCLPTQDGCTLKAVTHETL